MSSVVVIHTVIPAFERLSQESWEFKTSLGYIAKPCLKERTGEMFQWLITLAEGRGTVLSTTQRLTVPITLAL